MVGTTGKFSCELLFRRLPGSLVWTKWGPLIKAWIFDGLSQPRQGPRCSCRWEWMQKAHKYESHLPEFRASP